jgi:hypothetical protein
MFIPIAFSCRHKHAEGSGHPVWYSGPARLLSLRRVSRISRGITTTLESSAKLAIPGSNSRCAVFVDDRQATLTSESKQHLPPSDNGYSFAHVVHYKVVSSLPLTTAHAFLCNIVSPWKMKLKDEQTSVRGATKRRCTSKSQRGLQEPGRKMLQQ